MKRGPNRTPEKGFNWDGIRNAIPDFIIACLFLITWLDPLLLIQLATWLPGPEVVGYLCFLIMFEFIFVCAFGPIAFLAYAKGPALGKYIGLGVVLLFFLPFVYTFSMAAHSIWPAVAIIVLAINKYLAGRENKNDDMGVFHITLRWTAMGALYIICTFFAHLAPIPELGVEPWMAELANIDFVGPIIDEPQRGLATGLLYFSGLGLFEIGFSSFARRYRFNYGHLHRRPGYFKKIFKDL